MHRWTTNDIRKIQGVESIALWVSKSVQLYEVRFNFSLLFSKFGYLFCTVMWIQEGHGYMRNTVQILQKGQKVSEHTQVKTPAKQMIFLEYWLPTGLHINNSWDYAPKSSLEKCQLGAGKDLKLFHVAPLSGKIVEDSFFGAVDGTSVSPFHFVGE